MIFLLLKDGAKIETLLCSWHHCRRRFESL